MVRLFRYLAQYEPNWGWVLAETPSQAVGLVQDHLAADDDDPEPAVVRLVEYPIQSQVLPETWDDEVSLRRDQPALSS